MPRRTNPPHPPRHALLARAQRLALAGASLLLPSCSSAAPAWLTSPSPENILAKAIEISETGNLQKPEQIAAILGVKFVASHGTGNTTIFTPSDAAASSIIEYRVDLVACPIPKKFGFIGFVAFQIPKPNGCLKTSTAVSTMKAHAVLLPLVPPVFNYQRDIGYFRLDLGNPNPKLDCFASVVVQEALPN